MRVVEYVRETGENPFQDWLAELDVQSAAKIASSIYRLKAGNISNIKWFSGIGEVRINWGPGYRIYLVKDGGDLLLLLGGGTKKRQSGDIRRAVELHAEYKTRKALIKYKK
jgi:putative addiction module killer protein